MDQSVGYDAYVCEEVHETLNSTKPYLPFKQSVKSLDEQLIASQSA